MGSHDDSSAFGPPPGADGPKPPIGLEAIPPMGAPMGSGKHSGPSLGGSGKGSSKILGILGIGCGCLFFFGTAIAVLLYLIF